MKKHPCIECDWTGDKNRPECQNCRKRIDYVREIGGFPNAKEITVMEPKKASEEIQAPQVDLAEPPRGDKPAFRTCKVPGCNERHLAKGYCSRHYSKFGKKDKHLKTPNPKNKQKDETMTEKKPSCSGPGLVLDLTDIPCAAELIDAIAAIGAKSFRPMEYQAAKMLADAIAGREKMDNPQMDEKQPSMNIS